MPVKFSIARIYYLNYSIIIFKSIILARYWNNKAYKNFLLNVFKSKFLSPFHKYLKIICNFLYNLQMLHMLQVS